MTPVGAIAPVGFIEQDHAIEMQRWCCSSARAAPAASTRPLATAAL
jgi:hypothetical protein